MRLRMRDASLWPCGMVGCKIASFCNFFFCDNILLQVNGLCRAFVACSGTNRLRSGAQCVRRAHVVVAL